MFWFNKLKPNEELILNEITDIQREIRNKIEAIKTGNIEGAAFEINMLCGKLQYISSSLRLRVQHKLEFLKPTHLSEADNIALNDPKTSYEDWAIIIGSHFSSDKAIQQVTQLLKGSEVRL